MGSLKLLLNNSRFLRDINSPIYLGIEPESLLILNNKVVKFLKFPKECRMGPLRLLFDNKSLLRDSNNLIS